MLRFIVLLTLVAMPFRAEAGCSCRCDNGAVRAVCSSTFDIPPICSQAPCPFRPMSISPRPPPLAAPGKPTCPEVKACDGVGNCEWTQKC